MPTVQTARAGAQRLPLTHSRRVLTFRQWCELNGFSTTTGHRILASGSGPRVVQLSTRRVGITEADNAAWQESRMR
jgi:predicted DNA-binding transcriptional regulator AlpA